MREMIFLMGYKTLCVDGEGLLAVLLILPRSDCTALSVKRDNCCCSCSRNLSFPEQACAVLLCPALPEQPARFAGCFGAL